MKKLILVRHGTDEGGRNGHLTESGRKEIADLAEKLAPHINGASVLMLSSTALRALDSAEIFFKRLNIAFEPVGLLWSGGGGVVCGIGEDYKQTLELLNSHPVQADIVVLVTHYEYVQGFPTFFGDSVLGVVWPYHLIPKGTAWLIDCEGKQLTHVK